MQLWHVLRESQGPRAISFASPNHTGEVIRKISQNTIHVNMTHRRSIKIPESFMWFNHTGEIAKLLSPLEKEGQNWTEQELLTEK